MSILATSLGYLHAFSRVSPLTNSTLIPAMVYNQPNQQASRLPTTLRLPPLKPSLPNTPVIAAELTKPPIGFHNVQQIVENARRSHINSESRQNFFKIYNEHIASALTVEEANLQFLTMRLLYMHLMEGQRLNTPITHNVFGQPVHDYAAQMQLLTVRHDHDHGASMLIFEPISEPDKAVVVAFPGTSSRAGRDVLLYHAPLGLRSDFDPEGIGYQAFLSNRSRWLSLITPYLERQQKVVLAGFSLGGVYAKRLYACLGEEYQALSRVITFHSPGLDISTALQLGSGEHVRMIRHRLDLVPRFGDCHPAGTVISGSLPPLSDMKSPHRIPELARAQLDGNSLGFVASHYYDRCHQQPFDHLEKSRARLGSWLQPILPA